MHSSRFFLYFQMFASDLRFLAFESTMMLVADSTVTSLVLVKNRTKLFCDLGLGFASWPSVVFSQLTWFHASGSVILQLCLKITQTFYQFFCAYLVISTPLSFYVSARFSS